MTPGKQIVTAPLVIGGRKLSLPLTIRKTDYA